MPQDGDFTYTESGGNATVTAYTGTDEVVSIPSTLGGYPTVEIAGGSFVGSAITSLTIPSSVTTIQAYGLYGFGLIDVVIPDSVTSLGAGALSECYQLGDVTLGSGVTNIGDYMFYYSAVGSVVIRGAITQIGESAFMGGRFASISLPTSLTSIGNAAFEGCTNLTSISFPGGVTSMGYGVFSGCSSLAAVSLPGTLTSISNGCFNGCNNLASITIPSTVTTIEDYALAYCPALTSITFLGAVAPTSVGADWLYETNAGIRGHALASSDFPAPPNTWNGLVMGTNAVSDWAYSIAGGNVTVTGYLGAGAAVIVPAVFESCPTVAIGASAFASNTTITAVQMDVGVASIGASAFSGCTSLTSLIFMDLVAPTSVGADWILNTDAGIRGHAYSASNFPTPGNAFNGLTMGGLIDPPDDFLYTISGGEATVTGYTGAGGAVDIPTSFEGCPTVAIAASAFEMFDTITSVIIPNSVTSLGDYAFNACTNMTSLTLGSGIIAIGVGAFDSCAALTAAVLPSGVTSIGSGAFAYCAALASMTIPSGVTSIESSVFTGCATLASVTLANGVTSIGREAFYGCVALPSITIPNSVTSIGQQSFASCGELASVTIGGGVSSIGDQAFEGCVKLAALVLGDGVTSVGLAAFNTCTALASVTIGSGLGALSDYMFDTCSTLTDIIIPANIASIGEGTFSGCATLARIIFYETVAPASVGSNWVAGTAVGIRGHALSASDFPVEGAVFHGLTMGAPDYTYTLDGGFADIVSYFGLGGEITIPNTIEGCAVRSIGNRAFYDYRGEGAASAPVTKILGMPASLTTIGDFAFAQSNTMPLTSVVFGSGVTSIGRGAFNDGEHLENVTLPSGLLSIGQGAFFYCFAFTSVTIPDSVTSLGQQAFALCGNLTSLHIGSGLTTLPSGAFEWCASLTSVDIPANITTIEGGTYGVFEDCNSLTTINFLGLVAPTAGAGWLLRANASVLGHAYAASNFPTPGNVFPVGQARGDNGILMGANLAVPVVPDAPTLDTAVAGNALVSLTWTAPADDGGSAITGYKVFSKTSSPPDTQFLPTLGVVLSVDVTGLTNGTPYFFGVKAVNAIGDSVLSNILSETPVAPVTAPFYRRAPPRGKIIMRMRDLIVTSVSVTSSPQVIVPAEEGNKRIVLYNDGPGDLYVADNEEDLYRPNGVKHVAGGGWTYARIGYREYSTTKGATGLPLENFGGAVYAVSSGGYCTVRIAKER